MPDKCPKCGAQVVMVEYILTDKHHYDGISEYACAKPCGWRIGRWCELELGPGEVEPVFHQGTGHPRVFVIEQGAVDEPVKSKRKYEEKS